MWRGKTNQLVSQSNFPVEIRDTKENRWHQVTLREIRIGKKPTTNSYLSDNNYWLSLEYVIQLCEKNLPNF